MVSSVIGSKATDFSFDVNAGADDLARRCGVDLEWGRQLSGVTELELRILWRVRQGLALVDRPFLHVARELELTEDQVLQCFQAMWRRRLLHHLGPIYFNEAFGQGLSLAAMQIPETALDRVSAQLRPDPAVVHLSTFRHTFNLWFTVAGKGEQAKMRQCQALESRLGYPVFRLPNQAEFFSHARREQTCEPARAILSELDWRLIELTSQGLPLVPEPYLEWANRLALSLDELYLRFQRLADWGILQRIAASPNYCRMGLRASALTVWDVVDEAVSECGTLLSDFPAVSQCSLRPRHHPSWCYNLLVLVHGRSRREVSQQVDSMARLLGRHSRAHDILFRRRLLKRAKEWPLQGIG